MILRMILGLALVFAPSLLAAASPSAIETRRYDSLILRDNLVALYLPEGDGARQVPLLGSGFTDNLLLFNVWIGLTALREAWEQLSPKLDTTLGLVLQLIEKWGILSGSINENGEVAGETAQKWDNLVKSLSGGLDALNTLLTVGVKVSDWLGEHKLAADAVGAV